MNTTAPELNHRLLIVDDNAAIHDDFRKILVRPPPAPEPFPELESLLLGKDAPVIAETAFNLDSSFQGQQALEMVARARAEGRPYALAFVDVRMPPGWDGIETIGHLWGADPELQVVICTAYSDYSWDEIVQRLTKSDNLVILKKPFDTAEVLQLAHAMTRKWTLAGAVRERLEDLDRRVQERTREFQEANAQLAESNAQLQKEVAERTAAEEALRRAEERFEKAFQASPMAMSIQAVPTQRYVDVNEAFLVLTGYSREEVLGRSSQELGFEPGLGWCQELSVRAPQDQRLRHHASKVRRKSGEVRDVLLCLEPFELGAEPHLLAIAQDITDRLTLESELRQAQKMEAVGQLAAGIAHDFNNLLTVIQGNAGLLLDRSDLDDEVLNSLRQIQAGSHRAAALTRQLLAYSRKQILRPTVLQLNTLLAQWKPTLGRLIGEDIRLRCDLAEDLPPVLADAHSLEQVLLNLAVNARDAMPTGGELILRTCRLTLDAEAAARRPGTAPGTYVSIQVTDTGHGIPPEIQCHIFEPFFTTKDVGKGTGLGLATAYGIVKQHEGWIELQSEVNRGTTFTISLPACDQAPEPVPTPALPSRPRRGHESILVVEDEDSVREITVHALRRAGYRVTEARNGREALHVWEQNRGVELLLTDLVMPEGLSGRRLAETLLAANPNLKVLYTSGYSGELFDRQFNHSPDGPLLPKPYDVHTLLAQVRTCLDEPAKLIKPRFVKTSRSC